MLLNLVRLEKQLIPRDLFSTPCMRQRVCVSARARVCKRCKLVIRA